MATFHIAWRELRAYFSTWIAWAILAGWLFITGFAFYNVVLYALKSGQFSTAGVFQFLIVVLLFVSPLLTMRLLAEERQSGTLEMLFTSPVTEWQVVGGKWLGAWSYTIFLTLATLYVPLVVLRYGTVDTGPLWGSYAAVLLVAAAFCAFGVFCSSLTESQVVAGFLCFGGLLTSWVLAGLAQTPSPSPISEVLAQLSVFAHFERLMAGALDTKDLIFFASVTFFFLFAATKVLESRKWK